MIRRLNMKRILAAAVLELLSRPVVSQQTAPGAIQGVILKLGTDEPLSKVTVQLQGGTQTLTTTTERDGRFYFPNLRPGTYQVTARRDGYVPAEYGQQWLYGPGQPVTVTAGRGAAIRIWMFATASISGHITSASGQPIANAQVSALKTSYQGLERVLKTVQEARTNELGEFRLFWLPPGRYYLAVVAPPSFTNSQLIVNNGDASFA